MPRYDVLCPEHGQHEISRSMRADNFCGYGCTRPVTQVISAEYLPGMRVEAMEDVGAARRDSTSNINLGLPGENVSLGKDSTGKERFDYKPRLASETNAHKAREIAKANNLTPMDSGHFRTVGYAKR